MSKAPSNMFKNSKPGLIQFKPLHHKDDSPLSDLEYIEMLGRKALEFDAENPYPNIPTKYPDGYDPQAMRFAKEVVGMIDAGTPKHEIKAYINSCITFPEDN